MVVPVMFVAVAFVNKALVPVTVVPVMLVAVALVNRALVPVTVVPVILVAVMLVIVPVVARTVTPWIFLHCFTEFPKSLALSESGSKSESTAATKVTVSLV